jgi:hypothetical protein
MLAALAAIGLLLPTARAGAARIDVTPSISLDQAYDSNVFNTDGNEKGDFILRATPGLTFAIRMPETTLSLRSSLTASKYYKYTELNSTSSAIAIGLDATPITITPRFTVAPSAHFVQARDSYARSQLLPSGDPRVPTSIASESETRKSRDYGAALRVNYLATPNTDFSVGGGFTKRQFLDNVVGGEVDSRVVTGETTLTYRFTPLFSSGVFFNTAYNTFENGRDSRTYSGGLTGTYLFSPSWTMTARAGASRTREAGLAGSPDRTTWSPTGLLMLAYAREDFRATLVGTKELSGGGSFGATTRRWTVGLLFSDRIALNWTADLSGHFEKNQSLDAAVSEDLTSASATAGIAYQPVTWASLHLSGTAFRQWSNGVIGTDLTRYSGFLGITLSHTYNLI